MTATSTAATPRLRSLGGLLGGIVLGAVLLLAVAGKVLDPAALGDQIRAEGVDLTVTVVRGLAVLVIALEAGLGIALVLGVRTPRVLVPTSLLVVLFLFLTGRALWRDLHGVLPADASCGCFGNLIERTPAEAFWQDLLLLVPPLALAWWGRGTGRRSRAGVLAASVAAGAAAILALAAPGLPLDDLATRLAPGVELASLCSGREPQRVCLSTVVPGGLAGGEAGEAGETWVVLADVRDGEFARRVPELNRYARRPGAIPLVVLTVAPAEEVRAFFWRAGPAFPVHEAPPSLLRPLYRRLPRSFRVAGGEVVETSAGIAPVLLR